MKKDKWALSFCKRGREGRKEPENCDVEITVTSDGKRVAIGYSERSWDSTENGNHKVAFEVGNEDIPGIFCEGELWQIHFTAKKRSRFFSLVSETENEFSHKLDLPKISIETDGIQLIVNGVNIEELAKPSRKSKELKKE
ncbi:hypothetical protein ACFL08_03425 [Patescibacteria group bacterium]